MFNLGTIQKLISKPVVAVINVRGVIDTNASKKVERSLKRVNLNLTKAVALVVNSPGGSPVQSNIITDSVKRFCKDNHFPLYTFAEDMAVSGGYFLLSVGDKVYVDTTSLVGSIGSVIGWMGFRRLIQDKKIETRRWTTQDNLLNYILDQFGTLEESQKAYLKLHSDAVHKKFIEHVENSRGAVIKVPKEQRDSTIYNADIFLGQKAVELGLADGVGTYSDVLYNEYPTAELQFVSRPTLSERLNNAGQNVKVSIDFSKLTQPNVQEVAEKQLISDFLRAYTQ